MVKIALTGGAYQARSVIAAAQRCLNLYPEPSPTSSSGGSAIGEPATVAHYPTPGLRLLGTLPKGPVRGIRQVTTGGVYAVGGDTVYSVDPSSWSATALGTITPGLLTPVSMQDNGLDMLVVDGTANGWDVTLSSNAFAQINDPNGMFVGADRVDYLDTFFIFNKPNTPQFYISGSLAVTFDTLDFANKESYSDLLVTAVVAKRLLYLFGERTTEIWYDAGATDTAAGSFPFAAMQSEVFVDHGCAAKYSPAIYDNSVFWLTRDRQGQGIVMMVAGYETKRVSTYAIENQIAGYPRIDDAIGFTYQLAGHSFYVLTFPHADRTWCYDVVTGQWHEWLWIDANGDEHRHRANCFSPVNGTLVVGDWQNGNLYAIDHRVFTDNGSPIKRVRSFPHMLADGKRVFYRQFLADMETGTAPQTTVVAPAASAGFIALPLRTGDVQGAAYAISADGNVAVGSVADASHSNVACYWVGTAGPTVIGPAGSEAFSVSADGSAIVGYQSGSLWRWTAAGGLVAFGTPNDTVLAMSADASRIVGSTIVGGKQEACYWNSSGTRTNLGYLAGHDVSWAQAVSADGSFIVGTSYLSGNQANTERAWRWTSAGGMVSLGVLSPATASRAFGVSDDGSLVAGGLSNASGGLYAFQWTVAGGMVAIPALTIATGVSGDGSTIVGSALVSGFGSSFFGYSIGGTVTVPPPTSNPTDPAGANGSYPDGISADGQTVVGYSYGTDPLPWIYQRGSSVAVTTAGTVSLISLRWSDDRAHSWSNPVTQDIGAAGAYLTSLQWNRCGYARDRVWEISWSVPMKTALQGAWIDATPAQS
jgi:uncharacterized membrane protein